MKIDARNRPRKRIESKVCKQYQVKTGNEEKNTASPMSRKSERTWKSNMKGMTPYQKGDKTVQSLAENQTDKQSPSKMRRRGAGDGKSTKRHLLLGQRRRRRLTVQAVAEKSERWERKQGRGAKKVEEAGPWGVFGDWQGWQLDVSKVLRLEAEQPHSPTQVLPKIGWAPHGKRPSCKEGQ